MNSRSERKSILISITGDLFVRNFLNENALLPLAKNYDLYYIVSPYCVKRADNNSIKYVGVAGRSKEDFLKRTKQRLAVGFITMWAYQKRSSSFLFKFDTELPRRKKIIYSILGLPIIRKFVMYLSELVLGRLKSMDEAIREIKPDWIIIPSGLSDSFSIDVVKSARAFGINHILIVNGWDNISCKGVLPVKPDNVGVWGQQGKEHAIKIHGIPPKKVHILGAPHFSRYYMPPSMNSEQFRRSIGVPLDKKIILMAGCNRTMDEVSILIELEKAIEEGELKGVHVLFRPHPWRAHRLSEPDFEDVGFKHVTIDPQVRDAYFKKTREKKVVKPFNFLPDLDYYPNLLNAVDCVMSPLSTFLVEALIFGKPTLAIVFPDGVHECTPDKFVVCEHFKVLDHLSGLVMCRERQKFIPDCLRILSMTDDLGLKERIKNDVKAIAYHDRRTYSERVLSIMKECQRNNTEVRE